MKPRNVPLPEADRRAQPPTHASDAPRPRRIYPRLSPIAGVMAAAAGLALILELQNNSYWLHVPWLPTVSPADAVDISLQRLVRLRVVARLQKADRLNGSIETNRQAVDAELGRVRRHPLYTMIKERMTEHLHSKGYDRVAINVTPDPSDATLSMDAETALDRFIHTLRSSIPSPNEKVAAFLNYYENEFGPSIAQRVGPGRYDATLALLIQLLFECPDDLKPVADAVKLIPRTSQDIEEDFRGKSHAVPAAE